jgi:uncharacterized protein YecT (DUF1311 family)
MTNLGKAKIQSRIARGACLALALALLASPAISQDFWGEEDAQKACAPFEHYQPGPAAQATEQDRKAFASEKDCYAYFYDPAGANDYVKGRRCCLARGDCNRELAMAFANGWGTKRDFDAATYFLCRAGDEMAPAEHWGMLQFLHDLRTGKETGSLDFCDQVTSGVGASWCTGLELDHHKVDWDHRIQAVEKPLGKEAQPALAALRKAAEAFAEADSALTAEPNRGGTIYPSMVLEGQIRRGEDFAAALERHTRKRAPEASPAALKKADGDLNAAYKKLVALSGPCPKDDPYCGNYDRDVVRDAQRSWLPYRDAWIAFYRLHWKEAASPEALDREIAAALTEQRTKELGQVGAEE